MRPLSCEKPPLWAAATARGLGAVGNGRLGPQRCLPVTKAGGSKLLTGTKRSGGGAWKDPQDGSLKAEICPTRREGQKEGFPKPGSANNSSVTDTPSSHFRDKKTEAQRGKRLLP